jgi:hypothetical protein
MYTLYLIRIGHSVISMEWKNRKKKYSGPSGVISINSPVKSKNLVPVLGR